jgi:hypothetical protein
MVAQAIILGFFFFFFFNNFFPDFDINFFFIKNIIF